MLGINEVSNPLSALMPLAITILSGYTLGKIFAKIFDSNEKSLTSFLVGNLIINFVFITGFIVFAVLSSHAKEYFQYYTYFVTALSILGILILIRSRIRELPNILYKKLESTDITVLFSIVLFAILCSYAGFVTYYHPIFSEYDFLYIYLPISKSILMGDGLSHDYFTGADNAIRAPPYTQGIQAWLIQSFGYSGLRLFPIYYLTLTALFVFQLAKTLIKSKDDFLPLISASAFLITPAILIVSSRFSLQQDLPFLLFLTSSFLFFSNLVTSKVIRKTMIMNLLICISLMMLTREIGLVLSIAIFFLLPATRFASGNKFLRILLVVLSLMPLYALTAYDIIKNGPTPTLTIRLGSLIFVNVGVLFVLRYFKFENGFRNLLSYSKFLVILLVPAVFIVGNLIMIHGPYPTLSFSSEFNGALKFYREIFSITDPLHQNFSQALTNVPRLDVIFISVAVGSIFLFYKLLGVGTILYRIKHNINYATIVILFLVLLIIWSYLLNSGFEISAIRHIAYFVPLLCVILSVGMYRHEETNYRLFYFGVMTLATFYFLNYDLFTLSYNNHFGGYWIDPFNKSILNSTQFRFSAAVIAGLAVFTIVQEKLSASRRFLPSISKNIIILSGLTSILLYTLFSSGLTLMPLHALDRSPPNGWEDGVQDIIFYLNNATPGNVLSLRAPAIPSFTNRTNFDMFSVHTIPSVSAILRSENSTVLKKNLANLDIRYLIFPNKLNPLYYLTSNLQRNTELIRLIQNDSQFRTIRVGTYDVSKFLREGEGIDLISYGTGWKVFGDARISGIMDITANVSNYQERFNRVFSEMKIPLNLSKRILLSLDYSAESTQNDTSFGIEIRDPHDRILWSALLNSTNGRLAKTTFLIPSDALSEDIVVRLYLTTFQPGNNKLFIHDLRMAYS